MDYAQLAANTWDTEQANGQRYDQNKAIMDIVNNFITASNAQDQQGPATDDQGNQLPSNPYADRMRQTNMAKLYALTDNPDQATAMPQGQLGPMVTALMSGASPEANAAKQWDMMQRQLELRAQADASKQQRLDQALEAKAQRQEAAQLADTQKAKAFNDLGKYLAEGRIDKPTYDAAVQHLLIGTTITNPVSEFETVTGYGPQDRGTQPYANAFMQYLNAKANNMKVIVPPQEKNPQIVQGNDEGGQYIYDYTNNKKTYIGGQKQGVAKPQDAGTQAALAALTGNQPQAQGIGAKVGGFLSSMFGGQTAAPSGDAFSAQGIEDNQNQAQPMTIPNPTATAQPSNQPAASNVMPTMPDPATHKGRAIKDTKTGARYISNGITWVKQR